MVCVRRHAVWGGGFFRPFVWFHALPFRFGKACGRFFHGCESLPPIGSNGQIPNLKRAGLFAKWKIGFLDLVNAWLLPICFEARKFRPFVKKTEQVSRLLCRFLRPFVGFHLTFSRHGIAQSLSALALLIWLNEKVGLHPTFSRHGIAQSLSALALLIWLNEKVLFFIFSIQLPHSPISRFGLRGGDKIGLCGGWGCLRPLLSKVGYHNVNFSTQVNVKQTSLACRLLFGVKKQTCCGRLACKTFVY